ncbi:MAG: hypothetical protein FJ317_06185 [SAR202 cluster bacterium]|nr:hypothetical protein [SAR202 cluster bacterium]
MQDSFWETGTADVALSFCGMLSDDAEAARCYDTIIGRARQLYATPEGLNGFCARVPERFRRGCP